MNFKKFPRENISVIIIFCYFLPIFFFSSYAVGLMSDDKSWWIISIGLLLGAAGSLALIVLLQYREKFYQVKFEKTHTESKGALPQNFEDEETELSSSIDDLQKKIQDLEIFCEERNLYQDKYEALQREFAFYKQQAENTHQEKDLLIEEYSRKMNELQTEIERKQQHSMNLEHKIRDLRYDIETLLQFADINSVENQDLENLFSEKKIEEEGGVAVAAEKMVRTVKEGEMQLKRCIDIAQKLTGSHYFATPTTRYRDPLNDPYAIDMRRLCDSLRSENTSIVLLYSQKEGKIIFANNLAKSYLGWGIDKILQDFASLIQDGLNEWNAALQQLAIKREAHVRLLVKTKSGQDLLLHCNLGVIPTGLFKNHVIGILYPA